MPTNCSSSTGLQHLQWTGCWVKPCRDPPWPFPPCRCCRAASACKRQVLVVSAWLYHHHFALSRTEILLRRGQTRIKSPPARPGIREETMRQEVCPRGRSNSSQGSLCLPPGVRGQTASREGLIPKLSAATRITAFQKCLNVMRACRNP